MLGILALSDVAEQHADAGQHRLAERECVDVVPAVQGPRPLLEARRLASANHRAEGIDPMLFRVRRDLAHPAAHDIAQAGVAFERRVDLGKAVVERLSGGVEDHLDDAEPLVEGFEQRPIALLRVTSMRHAVQRGLQPGPQEACLHDRASRQSGQTQRTAVRHDLQGP